MVVIRSSVRPLLRQVASIIAELLKAKGYHRDQFHLLGSWNGESGRLYLALLTSDPLDLKTTQSMYSDVMNRLRERLDEPGKAPVTWHISLIMGHESEGRATDSPLLAQTEEEEEVTDFLESAIDDAWPELKPSQAATTTLR